MFRVLHIPAATSEPVFDPAWLAGHASELDVVHLQSVAAPAEPSELADWVLELHRCDLPLVLTVTDPWTSHQDLALGVLIADAATVLALNGFDAAEIERRWGREAEVLPLPSGDEDAAAVLRGIHARIYAKLARSRRTPAA